MVNCYFLHNGLIEYFIGPSFSLLTCLVVLRRVNPCGFFDDVLPLLMPEQIIGYCTADTQFLFLQSPLCWEMLWSLKFHMKSKPSCSTYVVTIRHDQVFLQIIPWWFYMFHVSKVKCPRAFFHSTCFFGYEILKSSTACIFVIHTKYT